MVSLAKIAIFSSSWETWEKSSPTTSIPDKRAKKYVNGSILEVLFILFVRFTTERESGGRFTRMKYPNILRIKSREMDYHLIDYVILHFDYLLFVDYYDILILAWFP